MRPIHFTSASPFTPLRPLPRAVPEDLFGAFDLVIMDPPFLNPDCLQAFASTTFVLLTEPGTSPVMVCTGAVMCTHVGKMLNARPTKAVIKHEGSRLSNPFALYVSYDDASAVGGFDVALEEAEGERKSEDP